MNKFVIKQKKKERGYRYQILARIIDFDKKKRGTKKEIECSDRQKYKKKPARYIVKHNGRFGQNYSINSIESNIHTHRAKIITKNQTFQSKKEVKYNDTCVYVCMCNLN